MHSAVSLRCAPFSISFVAWHPAPHLPDPSRCFHHLPDDQLIEQVQRLGGLLDEIRATAEFLTLVIPILMAEGRVYESFRYAEGAPLGCDITALGERSSLGGREDSEVSQAQLES